MPNHWYHVETPKKPVERPMLYSGPMVRAILANLKNQTRRIVKGQYDSQNWEAVYEPRPDTGQSEWRYRLKGAEKSACSAGKCPYGEVGGTIWVRETFKIISAESGWENSTEAGTDFEDGAATVDYQADNVIRHVTDLGIRQDGVDESEQAMRFAKRGTFIPSIHMPRWASRISLEITGVRIERLQDINISDVEGEGIERRTIADKYGKQRDAWATAEEWAQAGAKRNYSGVWAPHEVSHAYAPHAYGALWNRINGANSPINWYANPLVWVVNFKKLDIDTKPSTQ